MELALGMSFSKINNFNISNLPSKNLRSFKAAENFDDLPKEKETDNEQMFNKLTDDDIYQLSTFIPDKKMSKVAANTMKTVFVTIPVLDSVAAAVVKKGSLSSKLKYGTKNALRWGSVIAAGMAVVGTKAAINSKVKPLDDFDKKHPVLSTIVDFSAIYTVYDLFNRGVKTSALAFKELFPKFTNNMNNKVYNPIKNLLNNSIVNKKLVQPAEKFVEKRPYLGRTNKLSALMLAPAMLVASFVRYNREEKNRNEQVENNMKFLHAINDVIADKVNG